MKKIISLLLAIMMIAALAIGVSADPYDEEQIEGLPEGVTGYDVEGGGTESYFDLFEITKKYFVASFTFPLAEKAGTMGDNGCIGLTVGDEDYECFYVAHDITYPDEDTRGPGFNEDLRAQLRVGKWWGTSAFGEMQINYLDGQDGSITDESLIGTDVTIYIEGRVDIEDEETGAWMVTIKAWVNDTQLVLNGGETEVTAYDFEVNPYVGYGCKLSGVTAQIKFAQSNAEIDRSVLVNGVPDDTGMPGIGGESSGTEDPGTTTPEQTTTKAPTTTGSNNAPATTGSNNAPATTAAAGNDTTGEPESSNVGLIIGIVAAAVVVIAVVVVVIVKKKK